ncbi:amidohydrolase family protein [Microvirga lotononidis]|uniref:hypothetical protein n=1 Tax=Microvirga lotononidis TaxID=864069 RepID=UPI0012B52F79|nr:hypothetical protein [Microvirga lotononidis]WQO31765.1 hypothetical protein U0023_30890 [Microvirga lotononidis]
MTPALKYLGEILQEVGWHIAPSGTDELALLQEISKQMRAECNAGRIEQTIAAYRAQKYFQGLQELTRALDIVERRYVGQPRAESADSIADAIRSLPTEHNKLRDRLRQQKLRGSARQEIDAALAFVLQQFQYRYVNVLEYLSRYSSGSSRKIDLIICHQLDFDWSLAHGQPTKTSIQDQINVMEQISILTGGRVHCFAPFDPMRQVAYDLQLIQESPLALVQRAISSQGFIGVKMYPPMGFAPMGNSSLSWSRWREPWIAPALQRPDIGVLLDRALLQLYSWCIANNVPIMAHTSKSNSPSSDFEKLTKASYWQSVPAGLSVTFGHFGNTEVGLQSNLDRAKQYMKLMQPMGNHGANFYADSAYFTHAITNPSNLKSALRTLFKTMQGPGSVPLSERLMYGSDWEMLIIEGGDTFGYLRTFEQIFAELSGDPSIGAEGTLSDRFFGINAADHLSLHPGVPNSTRSRLDAFYAAKNVPKPLWATKVDMLPRTVS